MRRLGLSEAAMEAGSIMARRKRSELVTVSAMPWMRMLLMNST